MWNENRAMQYLISLILQSPCPLTTCPVKEMKNSLVKPLVSNVYSKGHE